MDWATSLAGFLNFFRANIKSIDGPSNFFNGDLTSNSPSHVLESRRMSDQRSVTSPLSGPKAALFMGTAVVCFHLAYLHNNATPLMVGYVICLVQLSRLPTTRRAFYAGLITGFLCVAPQLTCFWKIFGPAAIMLWLILALWIAAFTGMTSASLRRFGPIWTAVLVPFVWMGLEYFRSELYYLKFSWMNVGYAFAGDWLQLHYVGMYGIGFLAALCAGFFLLKRRLMYVGIGLTALFVITDLPPDKPYRTPTRLRIAGVQMEFPPEADLPHALDALLAEHPDADILVLSEYTLDGPVPASLKDWCRQNHRYLVVGGKDILPKNNFYDTAFVVGPDGDIVFRQGKSVPIQFFKDGLPAPKQELWNSPWGKIGFCVCYDLSYTRVIDRLAKQGAQLIIVPTMDVVDWGLRQHELHALVAPVRAAEYGIPIFRLASSGISQAVDSHGATSATAPFAGEGRHIFGTFDPSEHASLPPDRYLAPIAVAVTGVLVLILCVGSWRKKPAPILPDVEREKKCEASVATQA
jgi:apolipoprotein N-acyltransferase